MPDGAHLGIGAERALETILGGKGQPELTEQKTPEQMRAEILAAPIAASGYDGQATATARLILEAFETYPTLRAVPAENEYLRGQDGQMARVGGEFIEVSVSLYDILKQIYAKNPDALNTLSGLTGFMWGWAVNAARYCLGQPPVRNPAIIEVG